VRVRHAVLRDALTQNISHSSRTHTPVCNNEPRHCRAESPTVLNLTVHMPAQWLCLAVTHVRSSGHIVTTPHLLRCCANCAHTHLKDAQQASCCVAHGHQVGEGRVTQRVGAVLVSAPVTAHVKHNSTSHADVRLARGWDVSVTPSLNTVACTWLYIATA
jgi:hypothetical protein